MQRSIDPKKPVETKSLFLKGNLRQLKKYGQIFLKERSVIAKILSCAELNKDDIVLEIGSGHGELTLPVAGRVREIITVELDKKLCAALRRRLSEFKNIELIQGDFLKMDIKRLAMERRIHSKMKAIGNLPYYITTDILMKLFSTKDLFTKFVIMVQKEVAERMVGKNGKRYGALSLVVAYNTRLDEIIHVRKDAFRPEPEVDSAILSLSVREIPPVKVKDEEAFFRFTRSVFGARRKMIHNAFSKATGLEKKDALEILRQNKIDPKSRPENIDLNGFANLFNSTSEN